ASRIASQASYEQSFTQTPMNPTREETPVALLDKTEPMPTVPSLKRVIGVSVLAFSSFNNIVGSGIFGLPALVAALLGPAAILSYLVCAVLISLVGLCVVEVGSRVRLAGGRYAYVRVCLCLVVV